MRARKQKHEKGELAPKASGGKLPLWQCEFQIVFGHPDGVRGFPAIFCNGKLEPCPIKALKRIMQKEQITRTYLAYLLGKKPSCLQQWFSGRRKMPVGPFVEVAAEIARRKYGIGKFHERCVYDDGD